MRIFVLVLFVGVSFSCKAFDWDKCNRWIKETPGMMSPLVSTSSFFTSTGECAMIGFTKNDKKVFVAKNLEKLKTDSSRGEGEYIDSYAFISGCNEKAQNILPRLFQDNFAGIYGAKAQNGPKSVYKSMERVMNNDPVVSKGCKLDS